MNAVKKRPAARQGAVGEASGSGPGVGTEQLGRGCAQARSRVLGAVDCAGLRWVLGAAGSEGATRRHRTSRCVQRTRNSNIRIERKNGERRKDGC
jgi:hypothetical protein